MLKHPSLNLTCHTGPTVTPAGLGLGDPPASACLGLGSKASATKPGFIRTERPPGGQPISKQGHLRTALLATRGQTKQEVSNCWHQNT